MASTYINLPQVELDAFSLDALENITVTVGSEVEIKNDTGSPIPVSGTVTVTGVATETTLQSVLTELTQKTEPTDTQSISAASLPLPAGAATEVTSAALLAELQLKADLTETQPVSAASLPLPAGASTAALQLPDNHQVTANQGTSPWTVAGTIAATQSGTWDINDISGTVSLPTGASTAALQLPDNHQVLANQNGTWNITNISGTVSLPTGASTLAEQQTQTTELTAIKTAVQIVDDWDESDRAKVNPVVGQAGVAAGTGTDSSNTQRVSLATDVPLPTGTNSIGAVTQATAANFNAQVVGNIANAATDSGNPVKAGSKVNTSAPTYTDGQRADLQSDIRGSLYINRESRKRTYSVGTATLNVAAAATDIFTITGAADTKVKIKRIKFSGEATSVAVQEFLIIKRSTVNSGGTSSTLTGVPHESTDSAAVATVRSYTANPTLGTAIGTMNATKAQLSGAGTTPAEHITFEWTYGKEPTLLNASEVLALNFNGNTSAGSSLSIDIEWTEE